MAGFTITLPTYQAEYVQPTNQGQVKIASGDSKFLKTTKDGIKSREIIIDGKKLYICEQRNTCWVINSNGQKITDSRDAARYLGIETTEKFLGLYTTYHKIKKVDGTLGHRTIREEYSWEGDRFKLVNSEDLTPNYSTIGASVK